TINSRRITQDLKEKYNITNMKSENYLPPNNIPDEFLKYFILGLLDADGGISKTKRPNKTNNRLKGEYVFQMSFTGTKETCEFVKQFFSSKVKLFKRHDNSINNYSVMFQGNKQLIKYYKMLYDETSLKF